MFEKDLLARKRILVTGGGSGLGAAMGRRFAELGAELIICGRRLELLEQTAAQLRSDLGARVSAIRCDIRDGAAVVSSNSSRRPQMISSAPSATKRRPIAAPSPEPPPVTSMRFPASRLFSNMGWFL